MKTIHKFPLPVADEQTVRLPAEATILSVQEQRGEWCLWALVDPSREKEDRIIAIYGTGHPVDESRGTLLHISTWLQAGGDLVFHAFERVGAW